MVYVDLPRKVCASCQYWSGERSMNLRTGRIEVPSDSVPNEPCAMRFRYGPMHPDFQCHHYRPWIMIPPNKQ